MHYPHKVSNTKRVRKIGFRARMRTVRGRKTINNKRRVGRKGKDFTWERTDLVGQLRKALKLS